MYEVFFKIWVIFTFHWENFVLFYFKWESSYISFLITFNIYFTKENKR